MPAPPRLRRLLPPPNYHSLDCILARSEGRHLLNIAYYMNGGINRNESEVEQVVFDVRASRWLLLPQKISYHEMMLRTTPDENHDVGHHAPTARHRSLMTPPPYHYRDCIIESLLASRWTKSEKR